VTDVLTRLPRPRDVSSQFGIYVHVPFCSHRCWYCDFNAYAGLDHFADAYMEALAKDARDASSAPADADLADRPTVTSIFIGGGTPSLVSADSITRVIEAIRDSWPVAPDAEITIECNPESLDVSKLDAYRAAGINRISVGVQSLDERQLATLGRQHSAQRAIDVLHLARERFDNVSGDLIFGVPGEDEPSWRTSLEGVLDTGVTHLSCYALIYEEGTPLESFRKLGKVIPVDDDDVADRWDLANELLASAGFDRYEISNWTKPGADSVHNGLYWACGEYLGIGAGAHSHLANNDGAMRSWTVKGPERYVDTVMAGDRPVLGAEPIDAATRASEVMILGLRRTTGVEIDRFEALVGAPIDAVFADEVDAALRKGLIELRGGALMVTRPFLANAATVLFAR
jgi:oxygen-independent coproporphyrinogen-3 oxidase